MTLKFKNSEWCVNVRSIIITVIAAPVFRIFLNPSYCKEVEVNSHILYTCPSEILIGVLFVAGLAEQ